MMLKQKKPMPELWVTDKKGERFQAMAKIMDFTVNSNIFHLNL